jgi:CBS domain-containing protein
MPAEGNRLAGALLLPVLASAQATVNPSAFCDACCRSWQTGSRVPVPGPVSITGTATQSASRQRGDFAMTTARDIMHAGAECIGEHQTLQYAAQKMRDLDVGALPICGDDDRLQGIITDRDIVTKCIASGADPATVTAGQLAQGSPVTIGPAADTSDVLRLMAEHQIRRLPVLDNGQVVGMISEADLARHLPQHAVGTFVEAICAR